MRSADKGWKGVFDPITSAPAGSSIAVASTLIAPNTIASRYRLTSPSSSPGSMTGNDTGVKNPAGPHTTPSGPDPHLSSPLRRGGTAGLELDKEQPISTRQQAFDLC